MKRVRQRSEGKRLGLSRLPFGSVAVRLQLPCRNAAHLGALVITECKKLKISSELSGFFLSDREVRSSSVRS